MRKHTFRAFSVFFSFFGSLFFKKIKKEFSSLFEDSKKSQKPAIFEFFRIALNWRDFRKNEEIRAQKTGPKIEGAPRQTENSGGMHGPVRSKLRFFRGPCFRAKKKIKNLKNLKNKKINF
jgi:hypothetical protein